MMIKYVEAGNTTISRAEIPFIRDLLHFVMSNNYISYDGQVSIQRMGTAMGTPGAVVFACIFMQFIEQRAIAKEEKEEEEKKIKDRTRSRITDNGERREFTTRFDVTKCLSWLCGT